MLYRHNALFLIIVTSIIKVPTAHLVFSACILINIGGIRSGVIVYNKLVNDKKRDERININIIFIAVFFVVEIV